MFTRLSVLLYCVFAGVKQSGCRLLLQDWQMTLKVILRLNQLSCLILTKVNIKDDFIKDMTDMHCLRWYICVSTSNPETRRCCHLL